MRRLLPALPWLALTLILALLLLAAVLLVEDRWRHDLTLKQQSAERELQLLASLVGNDLQLGNYQHIDKLIEEWGRSNTETRTIRLTTANGYLLSHYAHPARAAIHPATLTTTISYSYRNEARLELTKELDGIYRQRNALVWQLGSLYALLALLLTTLTYALLRYWHKSAALQRQQRELITIQAQLNQFKNTLDQILDSIFIVDPQSLGFLYVNRGAVAHLGHAADALLRMTISDINPEFDDARARHTIAPLISGELQTMMVETIHRHKNGNLIPVEVFLQYISLPHADEPPRIVAIVRDISERQRVAAELQQYREHLEELVHKRTLKLQEQARIIDQTHDAIITTDLDGFISRWNGGAERLFGIPREVALGQHIAIVYDESQHEFLRTEVIGKLKAKGNHETEVRMKRADGSQFFAHISLSLLYDEDGVANGMIGYSTDITALKEREAALSALNDRLQSVNRELEAFSYSVSHDLRAPLRAIDGFSLALLEEYGNLLDDNGQDYLRRVRKGSQRMGHLIDDLLQLSRVTRSELQLKQVNLSQLAAATIEELQQGDTERRVTVTIAPNLRAYGDPTLLQVLLANLLGNAWKFTRGQPAAAIEFGRRADHDEPTFFIRDNGAGFDMKYAAKLFVAFQRLHGIDEFEGTGIGLATVQRIISRHGGRIWVEARVGKGATFYFTLPGPEGGQDMKRQAIATY